MNKPNRMGWKPSSLTWKQRLIDFILSISALAYKTENEYKMRDIKSAKLTQKINNNMIIRGLQARYPT